jgi:hypothetical protein
MSRIFSAVRGAASPPRLTTATPAFLEAAWHVEVADADAATPLVFFCIFFFVSPASSFLLLAPFSAATAAAALLAPFPPLPPPVPPPPRIHLASSSGSGGGLRDNTAPTMAMSGDNGRASSRAKAVFVRMSRPRCSGLRYEIAGRWSRLTR